MKHALLRVFSEATWRGTALLLLGGAAGVLWFTCVVTLLSLSVGLSVTLVGVPLLAMTVQSGRTIGAVERARLRGIFSIDVPAPPTLERPVGLLKWLRSSLADGAGWKGLAYGVIMLPWGVTTFAITAGFWSLGLGLFTAPLWNWAIPDGGVIKFGSYEFTGTGRIGLFTVGVVMGASCMIATPKVVAALAHCHAALVRSMLSANGTAALKQRVDELQASRTASVDVAEAERRRIERDLHDGPQQLLVGLAIDLGMARERLADSHDTKSRELVERAHDGVKDAIAELRNLARGIHPAVLTDRGIDAAVSALAARSPIPVHVDSRLHRRFPAAIESAAYFVVAEAMTNAMKHSNATHITVNLMDNGDALIVEVIDDGVGGAQPGFVGGLHGLGERLRALDGELEITSPRGGPTQVKVSIPCAL